MRVETLSGVYDIPFTPGSVSDALTTLVVLPNVQRRIAIPNILETGVRYRREIAGDEYWKQWWEVLDDGEGDCEDLTAWVVAYDLQRGIPSRVCALQRGPSLLHMVVARPDWAPKDALDKWQRCGVFALGSPYRIVDPSRALGM